MNILIAILHSSPKLIIAQQSNEAILGNEAIACRLGNMALHLGYVLSMVSQLSGRS